MLFITIINSFSFLLGTYTLPTFPFEITVSVQMIYIHCTSRNYVKVHCFYCAGGGGQHFTKFDNLLFSVLYGVTLSLYSYQAR